MDVSIVIVNWNSKDYLRKCLESIILNTVDTNYEVIVIDSGSNDGCGRMLEESFSEVLFIESKENLGFAKANNEAAKRCSGDFILFLNPDTELRGPAIDCLLLYARSLQNAGALGAKLLNTDGTIQSTAVQAFPTILNQVLNTERLFRMFPSAKIWGSAALFESHDRPTEVDSISGACLMMRRSDFEAIDGFSTDYFMYSEDVDLCYKAREKGSRNYYIPSAIVVHHGGGSSSSHKVSTFSSVMLLESRWRYFRKVRSPAYGAIYKFIIFVVSVVRLVTVLLMFPFLALRGVSWRRVWCKWLARFRWAVGLEGWAARY
jgi:N-acetylglucosaminyl-diphospho-decaprenol L-rhamnosyltransferase